MSAITLSNLDNIDIAKPEDFAEFVALAKEVTGQLQAAWGYVEEQMMDRNVEKVQGDWGSLSFETAKLLQITDESVLDPTLTKLSLDTKKVHGYQKLFETLPEGVAEKTVHKFVKRIK